MGSPLIYIERAKLLRSTGIQTLVQTIMPGRFHAINEGKEVFYVQSMSRDHTKAEQVFLAKRTTVDEKTRWDVLWADQAFAETDPKTGEDYIILQNGKEYQESLAMLIIKLLNLVSIKHDYRIRW